MKANAETKIGIIGGSLAGCQAAILLGRAGYDVTVFERSTGQLQGRGGGIGTPLATFRALIEDDIIDADFPHLVSDSMPFTGRLSADDRLGQTAMTLPIELATFHWGTLWTNLRKRVPDHVYLQGQQINDVWQATDGTVMVQTEGGRRHQFDLVLFADGYRSLGRQRLFPQTELKYRGYALWRGLVPESELADGTVLGSQMPRLSYEALPGHMVLYYIPGHDEAVSAGDRLVNWAAYVPVPEAELDAFLVDRQGRRRDGSLPPGSMRPEEEARLQQLMMQNLPAYYADIVARTENSFAQLIFTADLPAYARNRQALIGDAGTVVQPFTGSGVFKGFNNARDLAEALAEASSIDEALASWSQKQTQTSRRILALGEQMEKAWIWEPIDFARTDEVTAAAWWQASVTFPEEFTYVAR